jgi:type III secretory pathway component EscS
LKLCFIADALLEFLMLSLALVLLAALIGVVISIRFLDDGRTNYG